MKKRFRFRDFPLGFKLWLMFISFVIPCIILLSLSFQWAAGYTRSQEIYQKIARVQEMMQNGAGEALPYDASITVYSIGIESGKVRYITYPDTRYKGLLTPLIEKMGSSFSSQKKDYAVYQSPAGDYVLYYVIRKSGNSGVISYLIDLPLDSVYRQSFLVMLGFTGAALVLAVLFSLLFLKMVTVPLKRLERSASKIAEGDLVTPVALDRNDEIGKLSKELEETRVRLSRRDFMRQSDIQYVSHELKTPVMTIMSYAQSILDRIYPHGNLDDSVRVILSEAARLQRLVLQLLTVTKLDFMASRPVGKEIIDLAELAEEVCLRASAARPEISPELNLCRVSLTENKDRIMVLLENLFENAFRHAGTVVRASAGSENGKPFFRIYNDGGGIEPSFLPELFEAFKKGRNGVAGLGLSIVKQICDACGAAVSVENRNGGVEFTVRF